MRVEAFEENQLQDTVVRLRVRSNGAGKVLVIAVDESGVIISRGVLMAIGPYGVELSPNVNESLSFPTDVEGRLLVRSL